MLQLDKLSAALKANKTFQPTLVIDLASLDHNIRRADEQLSSNSQLRLVVKSLPSLALIAHIAKQNNCKQFMCFHVPFLIQIQEAYPNADILFGKPMPAAAFEALVTSRSLSEASSRSASDASSLSNIQWLIDSPKRLKDYEAIARENQQIIRVNLEINVGLNRGGFELDSSFDDALSFIEQSPHLKFSGLMGYEAHASKLPLVFGGLKREVARCLKAYEAFKARALSYSDETTCFNTGGSTTFTQYASKNRQSTCNDISLGSILLKPSDFDLRHLHEYRPAIYIATPLLKQINNIALPGPKIVTKALVATKVLPEKSGYVYGGNWLAKPVYPPGMKQVPLFGRSSNQELYSFQDNSTISPDDIVLLRPTQSESVLLQFGEIVVVRDNQIVDRWAPLGQLNQLLQGAGKDQTPYLAASNLRRK